MASQEHACAQEQIQTTMMKSDEYPKRKREKPRFLLRFLKELVILSKQNKTNVHNLVQSGKEGEKSYGAVVRCINTL
jgi:hypothetical protein